MEDFNGCPAYACWYPQMGGYVGRCVIVLSTFKEEFSDTCFEAYVWHDGEFPFSDDGDYSSPVNIHHCMPSQFIEFGKFVLGLQENQ